MDIILQQLEKALKSINRIEVNRILKESEELYGITILADKIILPVLEQIGSGWQDGKITLSQVYMSSRICEEFIDGTISSKSVEYKKSPKIAIAVLEDHHILGKRIIYSILKAAGYYIYDYGTVSVDELVSKVISDEIKILLISVLMLPSAIRVKDVRKKLTENGVDIKVIVGGAPFNFDPDLWIEVKADMMGRNASDALKILSEITGG